MRTPSSDTFYVYLVSSDLSSPHFANNTTVKFTNTLSESLYFDESENWGVALHYIQASNSFGSAKIQFIRLGCNLVQPGTAQDNSLAIFTRKQYDQKGNRLCYFEPNRKEYFKLPISVVSNISITLSDQNNKLLELKIGQPTVVCLQFKKMPANKQSFVIRVKSSDDNSGHSNDFRASLPPFLSVDPQKKWGVALNSMLYKGRFSQRDPNSDSHLFIRTWQERTLPPKPKPKVLSNVVREERFTSNDVPKKRSEMKDSDTPDLIELDEEQLTNSDVPVERSEMKDSDKPDFIVLDEEESDIEVINSSSEEEEELQYEPYNVKSSKIPFTNEHFMDNAKLFDSFSFALSKFRVQTLSGPIPNFSHVRLNPTTGRIKFRVLHNTELIVPYELGTMLGVSKEVTSDNFMVVKLLAYETAEFGKPINCNVFIPNSMFVYANFINFSPIGGVESPILKIIPLKNLPERNEYGRFESKNLETHIVIFSQLSNLRFQLRKVDGSPIHFDEEYSNEIIFSLQFIEL